MVAQSQNEKLGRQGLAGVPGGAQILAAPALGAGGEIQQALPGEVLDTTHAQAHLRAGALLRGLHGLVERIEFLGGQGLTSHQERLKRTQGLGAVDLAARVQVDEGQEAVPGHPHGGL